MKLPLPFVLLAFLTSCTTLVNRRDLYSPEPGPQYVRSTVTTTRTSTTTTEEPAPKFR